MNSFPQLSLSRRLPQISLDNLPRAALFALHCDASHWKFDIANLQQDRYDNHVAEEVILPCSTIHGLVQLR